VLQVYHSAFSSTTLERACGCALPPIRAASEHTGLYFALLLQILGCKRLSFLSRNSHEMRLVSQCTQEKMRTSWTKPLPFSARTCCSGSLTSMVSGTRTHTSRRRVDSPLLSLCYHTNCALIRSGPEIHRRRRQASNISDAVC